ncbi:MAG: methionine adenosyltransferase [Candidatus Brocadiae bacterium]|nr:methionine adenosyltransferase [Candidatus Brocadiia bacterium]
MAKGLRQFTSEAVSLGHPDKVADQISDAVLDELLRQDPYSRVACETMVKSGLAIVAGEIRTNGYVEVPRLVKEVVREIGYTDPMCSFNCHSVGVLTCLEPQSADIALGVDEKKGKEMGAGDQGIMFGFACSETPELMPMPIHLARLLMNRAAELREKGVLKYLRPDAKSQVTVEYDGDRPVRIDTVVLSLQHTPEVKHATIREDAIERIARAVIPAALLDRATKFFVNPTGRFVDGGPQADCGLTGRKIICDTYGGMGRHGGGAFSGKDCSKVDRSAAYAARHAAKNVVAAGLADRVEIQLSYAIGVSEPLSVYVNTFGTGRIPEEQIRKLLENKDLFRFSPGAMLDRFQLRRPVFKQTARYGHFGIEDEGRAWEKTDMSAILREEAGLGKPAKKRVPVKA